MNREQNFTNAKATAFTLAEVLITLGIIGIVAAMTIPTLINNYKKKQTSVKLKRFYSTINQAIQLSEIDNGSVFTWNKEDQALDENGDNISEAQKNSSAQFYNTYLAPYIKTVKLDDSDYKDYYKRVYFLDGSMLDLQNGDCVDFIYDTNGNSAPNTEGKDKFRFLLCLDKNLNKFYHYLTPNKAFGSYLQEDIDSRDKALSKCADDGRFCTVLLEVYDNLEFKDDYPYKL